jgi:TonB family protein
MFKKKSLLFTVVTWSFLAQAESGGLSSKTIQDTIQKNINGVLNCYNGEVKKNDQLKGMVHLSFDIEQNGKVINAAVSKTTLNNKATENCIIEKSKTWSFPKPTGSKPVHVDYPFDFRKVKKS